MKGSPAPMKKIAVASANPVKLGAAADGYERVFPGQDVRPLSVRAASGVGDQPSSSEETLRGAENRAHAAVGEAPEADYWVGIEGGVEETDAGMAAFAWVVVLGGDGRVGRGRSGTFFLPEAVAALVRSGKELGEADDIVFGRCNSKQEEGAVGLLTGGAVDRRALYAHAMALALVAFRHPEDSILRLEPKSGTIRFKAVRMNERTRIVHVRQRFRPGFGEAVGADLMAEAGRLRGEHSEALAASAVLVDGHGDAPDSMARLVHHPSGAEAPVALVAGRHSRCDLGSIPGASLRHALLLLWPPADRGALPTGEVIDLGTQAGITLVDGRFAARVVGSEPIRFAVAGADVVLLHARAGEPFDEPAALAPRLSEVGGRTEVTLHAQRPDTRHLDVSGILEEALPPDAENSCLVMTAQPSWDRAVGPEHTMLTQFIRLDNGRVRARVRVRAQDLERGVRLGRYLRCRGASVLGRDGHVSRVHALVLDRGGKRWLFDTASTNGTEVWDGDTGVARGPVRGERTFLLREGQAPLLAGQIAFLDVGTPDAPS